MADLHIFGDSYSVDWEQLKLNFGLGKPDIINGWVKHLSISKT